MNKAIAILSYLPEHHPTIRRILERIAWDERYNAAAEQNAVAFAKKKSARGVYVDTPVSHLGGRKFGEALGHQLAYRMPRYYEDGLDGVTYQKFFTPCIAVVRWLDDVANRHSKAPGKPQLEKRNGSGIYRN